MKRTAVIIVIAGVLAGAAATAQSPAVSFHKDVEPILQKNCQDMPSTRPSRAHVLHDVRERPARTKNNVLEWIAVIMPSGFTKDTWITSVQIKPEFPEVAHHICIGYVPHNPQYKYGVAYWTDKERDSDGAALPDRGSTFLGSGTNRSSDDDPTPVRTQTGARVPPPMGTEDCYLPGNFAADYRPVNAAKLIPAGSDIAFNLHDTPNGKAVTDHVKVGFTVASKPLERRYISLLTSSPTDPKRFAIPPNTPNWESPPAEVDFLQDAELAYLMPHMHARGKDMTYSLEFPDGRKQVILLCRYAVGSSSLAA